MPSKRQFMVDGLEYPGALGIADFQEFHAHSVLFDVAYDSLDPEPFRVSGIDAELDFKPGARGKKAFAIEADTVLGEIESFSWNHRAVASIADGDSCFQTWRLSHNNTARIRG